MGRGNDQTLRLNLTVIYRNVGLTFILQIVDGLKTYFDKTLRPMLLYPEEIAQARKALEGGKSPSSVYGAEHLLRLFVKLPEILPYTSLDDESLEMLIGRLLTVLAFLKDSQYFTD